MESKSDIEPAVCACVENCKCFDGETEIAHVALFCPCCRNKNMQRAMWFQSRKVFVAAAKKAKKSCMFLWRQLSV
ncbi:hypothetical protein CEXT_706971 [Caerostris extrusa]|uniref:Uncharacterized protein n=1 Tax=Caerostris extrusa TaxID=172846 RepID=A0AAV4Y950_CAEEX|nr:hypothetical protein CEXT_706971 [Caerostris extrusa]